MSSNVLDQITPPEGLEASFEKKETFDFYYKQIREPKVIGFPIDGSDDEKLKIVEQLCELGITVKNYKIDIDEFSYYFELVNYSALGARGYYQDYLKEKSLEHYVAAKLLEITDQDIYIDIASEGSPAPMIYSHLTGAKTYRQDLSYPWGLHGATIGGNAAQMPIPENFATKMALHCSFEHFEKNNDIDFIAEITRVLQPGGVVCILPLYLSLQYGILLDPRVALSTGGIELENDDMAYCFEWNNRHARFYSPQQFFHRIIQNSLDVTLTIYNIENFRVVDPSCYLRFALCIEKNLSKPKEEPKSPRSFSANLKNFALAHLSLSPTVWVAFPDWEQPYNTLSPDLEAMLIKALEYAQERSLSLLISLTGTSITNASQMLGDVIMNLLARDLLITEQLDVQFLETLLPFQWQTLLDKAQGYFPLTYQNHEEIKQVRANKLLFV